MKTARFRSKSRHRWGKLGKKSNSKTPSNAVLRVKWQNRSERRFAPTNLARTAILEEPEIRETVDRIWLTYLLRHVDELRPGQILHIGSRRSSNQDWLDECNALTIYKLAANAWRQIFEKKAERRNPVETWEASEGNPLYMGSRYELHWDLLKLILPRICNAELDPRGDTYVTPPPRGWRDILRECNDFVRKPISWGIYVQYVRGIEDMLYYAYPGVQQFNSRFRDRLSATFDEKEGFELAELLKTLVDNRGRRQTQVSATQASYLKRAQEQIGDLLVGGTAGKWRLDSFRLS